MTGLSLVGSTHRNAPQTSVGRRILTQSFYEMKDTVAAPAVPANIGQMGGVRVKTHEMYDNSAHSDGFLL